MPAWTATLVVTPALAQQWLLGAEKNASRRAKQERHAGAYAVDTDPYRIHT
jgi:hypothetical protein